MYSDCSVYLIVHSKFDVDTIRAVAERVHTYPSSVVKDSLPPSCCVISVRLINPR